MPDTPPFHRLAAGTLVPALAMLFLAAAPAPTAPVEFSPPGPATSAQEADPASLADSLRALNRLRAHELGIHLGQDWAEEHPAAPELRALYVRHLVNHRRPMSLERARGEAAELAERAPGDPWTRYAVALVEAAAEDGDDGRALAASRRALADRPGDADFLALRTWVLSQAESDSAALAFLEGLPEGQRSSTRLRSLEAGILLSRGRAEDDRAEVARAERIFAEIRREQPGWVIAHELPGRLHLYAREMERALPLLERAAELSPAIDIHRMYWRAVRGQAELDREEKVRRIREDVDGLLARTDSFPAALQTAVYGYDQLGLEEERDQLERRVLERHPASRAAEWIRTWRYRRLRERISKRRRAGEPVDPALQRRLREQLLAFVRRPDHHHDDLLGNAYRTLVGQMQATGALDSLSVDSVWSLVRGLHRWEAPTNAHYSVAEAAEILAERGIRLDSAKTWVKHERERGLEEAERLAREGASAERYEGMVTYYRSEMNDALGWIHFHEGRLDSAEVALRDALEAAPNHRDALYHLGRTLERRAGRAAEGREAADPDSLLAQAARYYRRGALAKGGRVVPSDSTRSRRALEEVYRRLHGGLEGLEDYLARAEEERRRSREDEVLAGRIEDPERVAGFEMETLADSAVRLSDSQGTIRVIHFWGKWCAPCVAEMPDWQAFVDEYAPAEDVTVLTINSDTDPSEVRRWMEEEGWSFPVLIDRGYADSVGMHSWPTTWFLGPEGRKHFVATGTSEALVREFGWRVEALRERAGGGQARP